MIALLVLVTAAAAQDGSMLGSVPCPNGHSDCGNIGVTPNYCASYQGTEECWPCIFCTFFEDSVDGSCAVCGDVNIQPIDTNPGGEAPGEAEDETTEPAPTEPEPTDPPATDGPAGECPRNCGVSANGGGTCRLNGRCTSCNDGRLLHRGRCVQSLHCRAGRVQSGALQNEGCRCDNENCHNCIRTAAGDTCRRCRNGAYMLDGDCVDSCPAQFSASGVGLFGRRCHEPFTCQGGRITTHDVTYGCKCAADDNTNTANCHRCEHRAGEFGQHCLRCNGGKYLHNERCHNDCTHVPELVQYFHGSYGSECRAAFICTDGTDESGNRCKCPRSLGDCNSCSHATDGATCLD